MAIDLKPPLLYCYSKNSICCGKKLRYPPAKCNPMILHSDALRDNACFFSNEFMIVNTYPHHPLMSYFSREGGVTHFPLASPRRLRDIEGGSPRQFPDVEGMETRPDLPLCRTRRQSETVP